MYLHKKNINCILAILLLPIWVFGTVNLTTENGTIAGSGVTKRGEVFPVIATEFTFDITEPVNGYRTINLHIPVKKITTENWMRDLHMRMSVFDNDYDYIEFQAEAVEPVLPAVISLTGNLIINGLSRSNTLSLEIVNKNGQMEAKGSTLISLKNYGIKAPGMGPMKVQDEIRIEFRFVIPTGYFMSIN